jgi:hypothetical protein
MSTSFTRAQIMPKPTKKKSNQCRSEIHSIFKLSRVYDVLVVGPSQVWYKTKNPGSNSRTLPGTKLRTMNHVIGRADRKFLRHELGMGQSQNRKW